MQDASPMVMAMSKFWYEKKVRREEIWRWHVGPHGLCMSSHIHYISTTHVVQYRLRGFGHHAIQFESLGGHILCFRSFET